MFKKGVSAPFLRSYRLSVAALTLSQPFGQRSARFLLEMTDELLDESAQLGAMLPKAALFNLLSIVLSYVSYIGYDV